MRDQNEERIDQVLSIRGPGLGLQLRRQLAVAIAQESAAARFDPLLILAVIAVESEFQDSAVSVVGAKGLMQIRPTTLFFWADHEGIRLTQREIEADPALRVRLGIRYLKYLQQNFGGDLDLALMAYNAGPTRLYQALKDRALDPFRGYPNAVRRQYSALRHVHGEPGDWTFASREPRR
jgi:soluble lytic murein transglycosylase-like protein